MKGEFPFSDEEIENNNLDTKLERLPSLFPEGTNEGLKKLILALLKKNPMARMHARDFCGGRESSDSGMDESMNHSNRLNHTTKSASSQNSQTSNSSGAVPLQGVTNHSNVQGGVVNHIQIYNFNSGAPTPIIPMMQSPFINQNQLLSNSHDQQHSPPSPSNQALLASPSRSRKSFDRSHRSHPYNECKSK